jgi:SHS2 domain-containing protein
MELRAEAATLAEAFGRIGLALFGAAVDPGSVVDADVREVRAHGAGLPALLRHWLQECLYLLEVEGFACRSIDFVVFATGSGAGGEALRLHAFLHGEAVDPARHQVRAVIRDVRPEGLGVQVQDGRVAVQATLEV